MQAKEIKTGMAVESEHKSTVFFIRNYLRKHKRLPRDTAIYYHIASDHLHENPKYYTKLRKCRL